MWRSVGLDCSRREGPAPGVGVADLGQPELEPPVTQQCKAPAIRKIQRPKQEQPPRRRALLLLSFSLGSNALILCQFELMIEVRLELRHPGQCCQQRTLPAILTGSLWSARTRTGEPMHAELAGNPLGRVHAHRRLSSGEVSRAHQLTTNRLGGLRRFATTCANGNLQCQEACQMKPNNSQPASLKARA